ncbi:hypothetical protein [Natrialba sp. INN-245]|uniref:hypothetical protein n=1 Tax=Natrialba sp. INN-245 TaxID=2690967 RepID=UPI001313140D|nr:hypothetical protein [Natrialba sp. INN-245]MWV40007.1 hypothetical protein [Natrialba sp. INN-245]
MGRGPVSSNEITQIYVDLVEDIRIREGEIQEELPVDTTAEIHTHLTEIVEDWETGRKSLRTIPVCNAYARQLEGPIDDSLKRLLTGLDASVNVLDDIIDTRELSPETRIALTTNVAFSSVLLAENCPSDRRNELAEELRDYFTILFQIPLVEQQLCSSLAQSNDQSEQRRAAEQMYAYRSRDIDGFVRISAKFYDLDPKEMQQLLHDLRAYRCRHLLFKDIRDVKRDLVDEDLTPIIQLLQCHESIDDITNVIDDLYLRFTYSKKGDDIYGDILREFENQPDDIHSTLRELKAEVSSENGLLSHLD